MSVISDPAGEGRAKAPFICMRPVEFVLPARRWSLCSLVHAAPVANWVRHWCLVECVVSLAPMFPPLVRCDKREFAPYILSKAPICVLGRKAFAFAQTLFLAALCAVD